MQSALCVEALPRVEQLSSTLNGIRPQKQLGQLFYSIHTVFNVAAEAEVACFGPTAASVEEIALASKSTQSLLFAQAE